MLLMLNAVLLGFVNVTITGVLGLPSGWLPKLICCGVSPTEGKSCGLNLLMNALFRVFEPW